MKNFLVASAVFVIVTAFSLSASGQMDISLIDTPTANVLQKNQYCLNFRFYQQGGLLIQGWAGLTETLTIGASYGGVGVVGTEPIKGNPQPAFSIKYKLGEEGENIPFAFSVGYEGQGYGRYYQQGETMEWEGKSVTLKKSFYQINSKGFYLALSKKLKDANLYINGGINHSLEDDPAKAGVSFFLGTEFQATPKFSLKLEYNNGFHGEIKPEQVFEESSELTKPLRKAGGEVNLGLKVQYSPQLTLEIDFKDLTGRYAEAGNRTFQIIYRGEF